MDEDKKTIIPVKTVVNIPIEKVWEKWTNPEDIIHWNFASDEWHCPKAENDLIEDGKFNYRMEAKDGSDGFDFSGTYDNVLPYQQIDYTTDDNRKVKISFAEIDSGIMITETFEAEDTNPAEMQQTGWQAILDNFKKYTET